MEEKFECSACSKEPTKKINVSRFIDKMDLCFSTGNIEEARKTAEYWEAEAKAHGDSSGLLSVLNEMIGLYRRTGEKDKGMRAIDDALSLLDCDCGCNFSQATIFVNIATTLKAFGYPERGLSYFDKATESLKRLGREDTYEYSALLNNKSTALCELGLYDEGEECLKKAIEILDREGNHDVEIGVSYINMAHLYFDRDESYAEVERLLDLSWEYINSPRQVRDCNYAFAIEKCVPSLRYFKRDIEADALEETAKEIYARG